MNHYRLDHMERGHFVRFEEIEAENDVMAVAEVKRRAGAGGAEL